jgi:hypothetical protein
MGYRNVRCSLKLMVGLSLTGCFLADHQDAIKLCDQFHQVVPVRFGRGLFGKMFPVAIRGHRNLALNSSQIYVQIGPYSEQSCTPQNCSVSISPMARRSLCHFNPCLPAEQYILKCWVGFVQRSARRPSIRYVSMLDGTAPRFSSSRRTDAVLRGRAISLAIRATSASWRLFLGFPLRIRTHHSCSCIVLL